MITVYYKPWKLFPGKLLPDDGRPPVDIEPKYPSLPQADSIICTRCGMEFKGITGYVCHDTECPVFFRITC